MEDIAETLRKADILCVCETWLETGPNLPTAFDVYNFACIYSTATRTHARGRASGGLAFFLNSNVYRYKIIYNSSVCIFVRIENFKIIIGLVYANISNLESVLNVIEEVCTNIILCNYPNDKLIVGGDFNSRVAEENCIYDLSILNDTCLHNKRESLDLKLDTRLDTIMVESNQTNQLILRMYLHWVVP